MIQKIQEAEPRTVRWSLFPVLASAGFLLAGSGLFSGCYTLKQGAAMLGYLNRAVPLESLLEGDALSGAEISEMEKNRLFVERIRDIRRFAMEDLGLAESKNYTKYVEFDRSYLAAVVSASAKDSFTRHEWWFPVVGSVPYKGFFDPEDAKKERAKLEKRDLDVWIRGVDAFSTLGWFEDPLYSYMRDYPPEQLANLVIHELLHATIFIKGQIKFNEELAEFVGSEGARLYMESRYGAESEEYRRMLNTETDAAAFLVFIRELVAKLDAVYRSGAERETVLKQKEEIIAAAMKRFDNEYETRFQGENYRGFSGLPVNNAYLELYRLYHAEDDYLARLYESSGRNLPAFIAAAKKLNGSRAAKKDPRGELEKALAPAR
ncbi:MAG: aminopeptidase [Treponema sp.]|jgi:predicted aminopeptidase|nr:aminopeptidase [Treponema sp.]